VISKNHLCGSLDVLGVNSSYIRKYFWKPVDLGIVMQKDTNAKADYNAIAIKTAERIQDARRAIGKKFFAEEKSREEFFPSYNRAGLGIAQEYERMANRPVSQKLQSRADNFGFEFEHLGITLGTVIHNVDLNNELSDDVIDFIRATLLERKAILFRDQNLSEETQVLFGRRFGDLDAFPFGAAGGNPYILEISHDEKRPGAENGWHTDVTWIEQPSLGSIA
jgi:hypothetical protein